MICLLNFTLLVDNAVSYWYFFIFPLSGSTVSPTAESGLISLFF